MKGTHSGRFKRLFSSMLIVLALLMALSPASITLAQPPQQGGEQPAFTASSFGTPDGSSAIQMQETTLNTDYLAANGTLDRLAVVGGLTVAEGQASGVYLSGEIISPLPSTTDIGPIWAADVPAGSTLKVETRLQVNNGAWTEWAENPVAYYPVRDNQYGGTLIWVGGGPATLQFRLTLSRGQTGAAPTLSSLTLAFSDSSRGPTAAAIASQVGRPLAAENVCPIPQPAIVSRVVWGCPDGEESPRQPPVYQAATHIIVHHTATANGPQDWAAVVRAIWNFHANVLWWGDIGYNYLIDPDGIIYEGRAGGDDVVGIHDTFNAGSMGIGFIGCYGNCGYLGLLDAQPSQPMMDSGVALAAWKLGQKGVDPNGTSPYSNAGIVPAIAGGRDVVATYSPGDLLYATLPWMRTSVAQRVASCQQAACTIANVAFDKPAYNPGEIIYLNAQVLDTQNSPIPGAQVTASVTKAGAPGSGSFPMNDMTGYYQGSFGDTGLPGSYQFDITASDPGGRFAPCTASATATICGEPGCGLPGGGLPGGAVVKVEPERVSASWCSLSVNTAVSVKGVSQLRMVGIELQYDPAVIQVADSDPYANGVQVKPDGGLVSRPTTILRNEVDTANGHIYFEATMLGSESINGDAGLFVVDWRPQMPGATPLNIVRAELTALGGQPLPPAIQNGSVEIRADCVSGQIALQGRTDFSGATVTSASGEQTQTDAQGRFAVSGGEPITISYPGYLAAIAEPGTAARMASEGASANSVGAITLLAGDMNGDNVIDIFDVAMVASHMDTADPLVDLNGDGVVNILDLALIAANYGQRGPTTDWH